MVEIAASRSAAPEAVFKRRLVAAARLAVAGALLLGAAGHVAARYRSAPSFSAVSIAGMNDQEIASLLRSGKTVAILSVGGDAAAHSVAEMLSNAVVAPAVAGNATQAGLAAALEEAARALKEKGFRGIALIGEGGEARRAQAEVAEKLGREWAGSIMRVVDAGDCCAEPAAPKAKAELIWRVMTRIDL